MIALGGQHFALGGHDASFYPWWVMYSFGSHIVLSVGSLPLQWVKCACSKQSVCLPSVGRSCVILCPCWARFAFGGLWIISLSVGDIYNCCWWACSHNNIMECRHTYMHMRCVGSHSISVVGL